MRYYSLISEEETFSQTDQIQNKEPCQDTPGGQLEFSTEHPNEVSDESAGVYLDLLVPGLGILVLHHPPPQPEPLLVQLLVVGRDVTEPDVPSQEDLQVPVLVECYQVTDVSEDHH